MEQIFELNSTESKLNYIQIVAPSVFEKLQSKIQNGNIDDFRNRIIIDETVNLVAKFSAENSTDFVNGIIAEYAKER